MYPNYNNYYQTANMNQYGGGLPQMQTQPSLKGRPVSSLEEVRAANIDFDGSLFIFPDIANKRIYTKQINLDGTASLNQYELAAMPIGNNGSSNQNFITREEFESAISQLKNSLTIKEEVKKEPIVF